MKSSIFSTKNKTTDVQRNPYKKSSVAVSWCFLSIHIYSIVHYIQKYELFFMLTKATLFFYL